MEYSVVIPAHNEGLHLKECVTSFMETLPTGVADVLREVVIVENGSTDGTLEACYLVQQRFPRLIRVYTIPRGSYGEAIKRGMLESRGTHISILECDFLDAEFISASLAIFRSNIAQFVVGSKRHPHSTDGRPLKRRILTTLYNKVLVNFLTGYPGSDTHGLKSIDALVAKRLCKLAITTDEVFQTEIVLLAWKLGIRIEEVPVRVLEMRDPTTTILRRIPKVLKMVGALRRSLGRFRRPSPQLNSSADWPLYLSGR